MPLCRRRARRAVGGAAAAALVVGLVAGCTSSSPGTAVHVVLVLVVPVPARSRPRRTCRWSRASTSARWPPSSRCSARPARPGTPTSRVLTTVPGYDGLVDQCGFGVSFDSSTFAASRSASPRRPARTSPRLPGRAADGHRCRGPSPSDAGHHGHLREGLDAGAGARRAEPRRGPALGARSRPSPATIASVGAGRPAGDATSRPAAPAPGRPARVDAVLGAPAGVSRTLLYQDTRRSARGHRRAAPAHGRRSPSTPTGRPVRSSPTRSTNEPSRARARRPAATRSPSPVTAYVIGSDGQAVVA